jgi:hypothetical protein
LAPLPKFPLQTASQHTCSTASRILERIRGKGRGAVHIPADFMDLAGASRGAVDAALGRLASAGVLRRIARGVYDFPEASRFGPRTPSVDAVASAVARSTNETVVVSDAEAANRLGVSTQVPAQTVYLTTGTSRAVSVDLGDGKGFDIRFQRVSPGRVIGLDTKAGLVLRALHYLGRGGVDDATVRRLRAVLDDDDLRRLRDLRPHARGWMTRVIDSITSGNSGTNTSGDRTHATDGADRA